MSTGTLKYVGKLQMTQSFLEMEWKIPKYFSLQKMNEDCRSPSFDFLGATWIIDMTNYSGFLNLGVLKCKWGTSSLPAYYTIGIKCFDGSIYKSASGTKKVNQSDDLGVKRNFLRPSDLQRDQMKVAPQDVLTVFCSLRQEYIGRGLIDGTTQTEIYEGHANAEVGTKHLDRTEDEESDGKGTLCELEGVYKLAEDVKGLFLNGTNSDTIIKISGREFRAHRTILGARSSVFQSMFSHDTTERNTGTIEIEDCDPDVFQDFLLFLYSGKVEKLRSENVLPLYTLADKYDVQEVKRECLKFMGDNFCVDSFCDIVALALMHNEVELLKSATDFFSKNTKKVIVTANWQCFLKKYPIESNEMYIKAIDYRDQE